MGVQARKAPIQIDSDLLISYPLSEAMDLLQGRRDGIKNVLAIASGGAA